MSWLVTGGAGYIGAHVVHALHGSGRAVVVLDDLSTGAADRLPAGVPLVTGSTLDTGLTARTVRQHGITGVLHLAAKKQVGESVAEPLRYYRENVEGLRSVLEAAVAGGVRRFLFSSSAAVYGTPDTDPVTEGTPCRPVNPYGETKLAGEWLTAAAGAAHGLATASLRYFNVAGAARPELGDPAATNLVPMVFERLDAGLPPLLFGDDYATPDGSCVRDFIHVADVADAHLAAVARLEADPQARLVLNIGRGQGVSVREMLAAIAAATGRETTPETTPRRPGDPARVVAAADRIAAELGWKARHGLDEMVVSAWAAWRHRHR